ncbi:MAG: tetratricopeptide repeat protein [Planctomycetota bacterium]|jgi:tetratricopeptide (TPR) repeat protein
MRGRIALVLALLCAGAAASPAEQMAEEAKALYDQGRFAESLRLWKTLIAKHSNHAVVKKGDAHWFASQCHLERAEFSQAAALLEGHRKLHPGKEGRFRALHGIFDAWNRAGDEAKAQVAGKRLFKEYPDAKGTFDVVKVYLQKGWKVPSLKTTYKVLRYWTFNRVDGSKEPDLRIGFIELIEKNHPRESAVRDGGMLYCRAWCHFQAGRHETAIELSKRHLSRYPRASERDKVRFVLVQALLSFEPSRVEEAKKHIAHLKNDSKSRYREQAEGLLAAAESGGSTVQITEGCPKPEGLGKVVLLTNLPKSDARFTALKSWLVARKAEVVRFKKGDVHTAARKLRALGAEFVAVAVPPTAVDVNFHYDVLELCRGLDADPMPDFHFGYLCARNAKDLQAFTGRILEREQGGDRVANMIGVPTAEGQLQASDFMLHFGHGFPWGVVKGVSGEELAKFKLSRGPVIFSGACFNGVLSRSYHGCATLPAFHRPEEIEPNRLISLAWVRAGATGLFAALEGDRGEMAMAEWDYFLSHAPALGEVATYQYRLAFTSLAETFASFPRYEPGRRKRMGFYDVMLRGMVSRLLLSDPSFRPLDGPLEKPHVKTSEIHASGQCVVQLIVDRTGNGPFVNYLPKAGDGTFDWRLYARVELPRTCEGRLGKPEVSSSATSTSVPLTRFHVKHEVWGGRRFVNLQAESPDRRLASPGTSVAFVFPVSP